MNVKSEAESKPWTSLLISLALCLLSQQRQAALGSRQRDRHCFKHLGCVASVNNHNMLSDRCCDYLHVAGEGSEAQKGNKTRQVSGKTWQRHAGPPPPSQRNFENEFEDDTKGLETVARARATVWQPPRARVPPTEARGPFLHGIRGHWSVVSARPGL